ncbi:MAG: hypothetical protein LBC07_00050 [Elusimicrobiota bacterium]|jgi:hypothetical protein|nr:hypothetical protein [Elusimicrobiota bacterium]
MYKCKYFTIKELVHPDFLKMTDEETLWKILDPNLLYFIDRVREQFGEVIINGGALVDCGLRLPDSKTGAKFSAHKYGKAFDLHIVEIEKKNLDKQKKIEAYEDLRERVHYQLLTESQTPHGLNFETGIYWLHIDTFNRANKFFKP